MLNKIELKTILNSVKAKLNSGETVEFLPSGKSMRPIINGKDNKVVIKKAENLKKNQLYLYIRKSDEKLVLHRLVNLNPLTFKGDGNFMLETGDFDIIGEVVLIKKRFITVKPFGFWFWLYSLFSVLNLFSLKVKSKILNIFNNKKSAD